MRYAQAAQQLCAGTAGRASRQALLCQATQLHAGFGPPASQRRKPSSAPEPRRVSVCTAPQRSCCTRGAPHSPETEGLCGCYAASRCPSCRKQCARPVRLFAHSNAPPTIMAHHGPAPPSHRPGGAHLHAQRACVPRRPAHPRTDLDTSWRDHCHHIHIVQRVPPHPTPTLPATASAAPRQCPACNKVHAARGTGCACQSQAPHDACAPDPSPRTTTRQTRGARPVPPPRRPVHTS